MSLKQAYDGHARQVAVVASQLLQPSYPTRYVIVVDDDIDVTNLEDVMWAVCTRSDPISLDHAHRPHAREFFSTRWCGRASTKMPATSSSCALIDACRPFPLRDRFPKVAESSAEFKNRSEKNGRGS